MVFSGKIIKLGKADVINGIIKRDKLSLYYTKPGNKVYKKSIRLSPKVRLIDVSEALNFTEIIPLADNVIVKRVNKNLWVNVND